MVDKQQITAIEMKTKTNGANKRERQRKKNATEAANKM